MAKIKYFKFEDAEKVFNLFKGLSINAKLLNNFYRLIPH